MVQILALPILTRQCHCFIVYCSVFIMSESKGNSRGVRRGGAQPATPTFRSGQNTNLGSVQKGGLKNVETTSETCKLKRRLVNLGTACRHSEEWSVPSQ